MHFFELFGELSLGLGLAIGAALALLELAIGAALALLVIIATKTFRTSLHAEEGQEEVKGIPTLLKVLFVSLFLWAAGYTMWVILSGVAI
jgi:hypothetical protein